MAGVPQEVQEYVTQSIQNMTERQERLETMLIRAAEYVNEMEAKGARLQEAIQTEEGRSNQVINEINGMKTETINEINSMKTRIDEKVSDIEKKMTETEEQVNSAHEKANIIYTKSEATAIGHESFMANLKTEIEQWAEHFRKDIAIKMGESKGGFGEGAKLRMDKKEVSVWKILDNVSKADFRHWLDTVDAHLESIHMLQYPDRILEKVRRQETEITQESLSKIIDMVNDENRVKTGDDIGDDIIDKKNWDFAESRASSIYIYIYIYIYILHEQVEH